MSQEKSKRSSGGKRAQMMGIMHTDLSDYDGTPAENIDLIRKRQQHFGGSVLFYHDPVHIVRGDGVWLFDQHGRKYLDCYNNVASVGHCNPKVVNAMIEQAQVLNTHTRYLHESVITYAEQLADTFPGDLSICMFVCTGTEANELAMRMARAVSGHNGAIVMEHSYHGNSTLISELSLAGVPRDKRPGHVVGVEPPNTYRGPFREEDKEAGVKYAGLVDDAIKELDRRGEKTAAFMCDGIFDTQGGLEAPANYFKEVYQRVRAAGGLCIADEVQPGFARTGTMWGFEHYDVIPDIVTLGKPMGNGQPIAGVVTTPEIFAKFSSSAFYFNTFGGNPVSVAVGKAVLDIIQEDNLAEQVREVGNYLRSSLEALMETHDVIGDVHGRGLYQAVEFVKDKETREPATRTASLIPDALKEEGILVGLTGRYGNVLKIRPPLVFDKENVDQLVQSLDKVLADIFND
jgi:4-aminobutyrate aminotransferase-like enzyme